MLLLHFTLNTYIQNSQSVVSNLYCGRLKLHINRCLSSSQDIGLNYQVLPHWISHDKPKEIIEDQLTAPSNVLKKIRPFYLNQLSVFNSNPYKLSRPVLKNPVIKHLWKVRVNPAYRQSQSRRLIVSSNTIRHMFIHTNVIFDIILATNKSLVDFVLSESKYNSRYSRIQLVHNSVIKHVLRGTVNASNIADSVAEVHIPCQVSNSKPRVVVALDNIKYPQNLGLLLRTVLAFNIDAIYYLKGTTDPYNWKTSMITGGIQYKIPSYFGTVNDLKKFCKLHNLLPVVGHIKGSTIDKFHFTNNGICIILGNESTGPSVDILLFAKKVTLPMHPLMNSLNVSVAGGILIQQLLNCLS